MFVKVVTDFPFTDKDYYIIYFTWKIYTLQSWTANIYRGAINHAAIIIIVQHRGKLMVVNEVISQRFENRWFLLATLFFKLNLTCWCVYYGREQVIFQDGDWEMCITHKLYWAESFSFFTANNSIFYCEITLQSVYRRLVNFVV